MTTMIRPLLLSLSLLALHVQASDKMKPGLWEMSMRSDAMKSMPKISPEQIEKMKQMGIKMPAMQNGAMVHKVCISKEMTEQNAPFTAAKEQQSCQSKNVSKSGSNYSMDLICDSPEMKGVGTVKGSATGDSMSSVYDFKGTAHGQAISQHMETSGKWLSSDCGDIKPIGEMPPTKK
ncbi:DUF3617 domain-containing protein [Undibacterium sp. SXout7W]|uniref:DUF3617 domain-containing protein n=1 Tax=Undibacterium sp. SXout7W TaxID=3413049 RepID=UPI003BEF5BAD